MNLPSIPLSYFLKRLPKNKAMIWNMALRKTGVRVKIPTSTQEMTSNSPAILTSNAWNERYQGCDTPWALQTSTPEFERLLEEKSYLLPKKEVVIPGSG